MDASTLSAMKGDKLREPAQWSTWYAKTRRFAQLRAVWELCNPEVNEDALPKRSTEPVEPEYPEDGDDKETRKWRDRFDVYKLALSKYEKQTKGLNDVYEYIFATIDSKYHRSVITKETPYDVLVALKTRFARSNSYKEELRDK